MAHAATTILPSPGFRKELSRVGAEAVGRCYQCATCVSVCELATPEIPFPRQQVLLAQWGMVDRLAGDPAIWLCHQCTDCSESCPRDVRPGDVLQALRATVIRRLAFPGFLGGVVDRARSTWPLLLFAPWLFWLALLAVTGHLSIPEGRIVYGKFVPHWMLYSVFFPVAGWVTLAAWVAGRRHWKRMGLQRPGRRSFLSGLAGVVADIAAHRSFAACKSVQTRRWGHFFLLWGFVGAAATSGLLIFGIYVLHDELPYPLLHPFKILGNLSAIFLLAGGTLLIASRFGSHRSRIRTTAFDGFFLFVVAAVIATGVIIEVARFAAPAPVAYGLYTVHLGVVMTLFLTFPYSKFAHMFFRTLALVHQRSVSGEGVRS